MAAKKHQAGLRELRQNLGGYLKHVTAGETLEVTDHGRPVAALVPLPKNGSVLDWLIATGQATPAKGDLLELDPRIGKRSSRRLSRALQEVRVERL